MGFLDDINKGRDITPDKVTVEPVQRIDTLVADPGSGEQRHRTDYAGTTWYGGRPQFVGSQGLPGRHSELSASFWLPDSQAYDAAAGAAVQVQATGAMQGGVTTSNGSNLLLLDVGAALGADPQNSGAMLIYVTVSAVAQLPFGIAYRVTVVCPPEALR